MKTKFSLTVFLVVMLVSGVALSASAVSADSSCDSAHVAQSGSVIIVTPTGVDDTANIQCAFDTAVATGPDVDVQLSSGTFHTAQIVVNDFYGSFYGAGSKSTVVTNLPNLYVTPVDMFLNPPSADNPWPSLFAFVNGDFVISDLGIDINGNNGTTGWSILGIEPPITELAHAFVILGTEANSRVERILIEGEPMEDSIYGYNLINGVYFEGFLGDFPLVPISGSFQVSNSTFRQIASGTPLFNLSNAKVMINRNRYENVFDGSDVADIVNSSVTFSHNQVDGAFIGFWRFTNFIEDSDSQFLIRNNIFRSSYGPFFEGVLGEGNGCLIEGNNVQNVTDIGVYLGPGTIGCTVVGGSNKSNVLDLGANNVLVGVNNMGAGVGPEIHTLLKMVK